jgi:hypothetical protein
MRNEKLTVLCGAGSPYSKQYKPVYDFLNTESRKRDFDFQLIDYVGVGQFPEINNGLSLPRAFEKVLPELTTETSSRLLCRSFGCHLAGYILSEYPEVLKNYNPVILWGPSPFHGLWELFGKDKNAINKFNEFASKKGVKFHNEFWTDMVPLEVCAKKFKDKDIIVAYGTEDIYCDYSFANYLNDLILSYTNCNSKVVTIEKARHEIKASDSENILSSYLSLIFEQ